MAVRGGKGGDPVAFGGGAGEGSGKPAGSRAGFDYAGEWEGKRLGLHNQPIIPSSTDAEGLDKGNAAEVEHQTKRFNAWNAAYEKQKAQQKGAESKPQTSPLLQRTGKPKAATNRTTGAHVEPTMGIKEFGQNVAGLHAVLSAHAATVGSVELRPEAEAQVGIAKGHLDDAKFHIGAAETARRGVIIGGKRYSGDAEAGKHYMAAVQSLRKAHDALGSEHVQTAAYVHNLTAELPTEHLSKVEDAAKSTRILKGGASFKAIPFGGATIDPNMINVKEAEKLVGKATPATAKLRAGQKGTKRQDKFNVVAGKEDKSLGGLPGPEVRTPGRNGAVGTPINPKRRASGQRSIGTSVPSANMARFQTPKFDATSKIEGEK